MRRPPPRAEPRWAGTGRLIPATRTVAGRQRAITGDRPYETLRSYPVGMPPGRGEFLLTYGVLVDQDAGGDEDDVEGAE